MTEIILPDETFDYLTSAPLLPNVPEHVRKLFLPTLISQYGKETLTAVNGIVTSGIQVGSLEHQAIPGIHINDMSDLFTQFSMMDLDDEASHDLIIPMLTQKLVVTYDHISKAVDYDTRVCDYAFLKSKYADFFIVVNPGAGTISRLISCKSDGKYLVCGTPNYLLSDMCAQSRARCPTIEFHTFDFILTLPYEMRQNWSVYIGFAGYKLDYYLPKLTSFKNVFGWAFNPFNAHSSHMISEVELCESQLSYSYTRKGYTSPEYWNYDVDYFRYTPASTEGFVHDNNEYALTQEVQRTYILVTRDLLIGVTADFVTYSGFGTSFLPVKTHNIDKNLTIDIVDSVVGSQEVYLKVVDNVLYSIDISLPINVSDRIAKLAILAANKVCPPLLLSHYDAYSARDADYKFNMTRSDLYYRYLVHSLFHTGLSIKVELFVGAKSKLRTIHIKFDDINYDTAKDPYLVVRKDVKYIFSRVNYHKVKSKRKRLLKDEEKYLPLRYESKICANSLPIFPVNMRNTSLSLISPYGGYYMVCPPDFADILNFKMFSVKHEFHYDYKDFKDVVVLDCLETVDVDTTGYNLI